MTPFNSTIEFLLAKDITAIVIGIILAIAFGLYSVSTQDAAAKKQARTWMWWSLSPILLFIFLVVIYGVNLLVSNSFG